jgi:hydroxymethylbilane synthase
VPPTRGLFVKELEEALLDGRAHLAVHSAKDLPADLPEGLGVRAVPPRADPRDALIGPPGGLAGLPEGARVATGSPRRRAQILASRPDVRPVDIRGNVGTRLEKLANGEADALVLAMAGLERLGLEPPGLAPLGPEVCVSAPGQGALAVEARLDREDLAPALAALDDPVSHACLLAERAALRTLGGGCLAPVGALCVPEDGDLELWVAVAPSEDGPVRRARLRGGPDDPEALGARAAEAVSG